MPLFGWRGFRLACSKSSSPQTQRNVHGEGCAATARGRPAFHGQEFYSVRHAVIFHGHVQIGRRDADIRVSSSVADLAQRATAGLGVADEGAPAVMDRETG